MSFQSLRDYLEHLRSERQIFVVDRLINKDTELMPLVRCQYRGLEESERRPFLFTQVTDAKKRTYESAVLVGALGASKQIYARALGCGVEEIREKWNQAIVNPIEPILVKDAKAPVHEEVYTGDAIQQVGLDEFPIPISTPGFDPAPFITCVNWVTKDPETGIPNLGNYRAMVKGRDKLGILLNPTQHVGIHWSKHRERGLPLEAAIVIGGPPSVSMAAVAKVAYGLNEYAVGGGLMGRPVELVPCKTVNLEVPSEAEIVLEGEITTTEKEPEGPFGEFSGFMGARGSRPYFKIKCITHRKRPIFQVFISQFPPSESTKIRGIANEAAYYDALKNKCNCPFVLDVVFHEAGGAGQNFVVIKIKKRLQANPWQALRAAASLDSGFGKIFIAVDEDVDPNDLQAIVWALCWRMQPHRDMEVIQGRVSTLDPSSAPPEAPDEEQIYPGVKGNSALLIDATRKWDYAPVSLPKRDYMERALEIWREEGLPTLKLREPWYGYTLGPWPSDLEHEAELAVRGDYYETGRKLEEQKITIEPSERN
ncbi:MAG: UbiD family decarboxylase [Deltaproteobacteria bacterium]|nr:MAG: UbiD family decarboxylase [Deltaproteobacteria bacterium]